MGEVFQIVQPLPLRECDGCGATHYEPGSLCSACRANQSPVPLALVAHSAASVIADLERLNQNRFPLAGPIADVLKKARSLYDAVGPRVQHATGEIHYFEGEFWAYPADADGVRLGPFGCSEMADDALVEFAADKSVAGSNERIDAERRPPR